MSAEPTPGRLASEAAEAAGILEELMAKQATPEQGWPLILDRIREYRDWHGLCVRCRADMEDGVMQFAVNQQTVVDKPSGLILKFWVDDEGQSRLSIWSNSIPHMNRMIGFNTDGDEAFSGTEVERGE